MQLRILAVLLVIATVAAISEFDSSTSLSAAHLADANIIGGDQQAAVNPTSLGGKADDSPPPPNVSELPPSGDREKELKKWGVERGKNGKLIEKMKKVPEKACWHLKGTRLPNFNLTELKDLPKPEKQAISDEILSTYANHTVNHIKSVVADVSRILAAHAKHTAAQKRSSPARFVQLGQIPEASSLADQSLEHFCDHYRRNDRVSMDALVAAKITALNPAVIFTKVISHVSLRLQKRLVTYIATTVCEFYNAVVSRNVCIFSKERYPSNDYSYLISRKTIVPCFSGGWVSDCELDTVYLPLPWGYDNFRIVDDIQSCGSLSSYLPLCDKDAVEQRLASVYRFAEGVLDAIVDTFVTGLTSALMTVSGVGSLVSAILENACVYRQRPTALEIPNMCASVLEPEFDVKNLFDNIAKESAELPEQLRKAARAAFRVGSKFIPVVGWIPLVLDEITTSIRKTNCAAAISALGDGVGVDLTYGKRWAQEDSPTLEKLIADAPKLQEVILKGVDKIIDQALDNLFSSSSSSA